MNEKQEKELTEFLKALQNDLSSINANLTLLSYSLQNISDSDIDPKKNSRNYVIKTLYPDLFPDHPEEL